MTRGALAAGAARGAGRGAGATWGAAAGGSASSGAIAIGAGTAATGASGPRPPSCSAVTFVIAQPVARMLTATLATLSSQITRLPAAPNSEPAYAVFRLSATTLGTAMMTAATSETTRPRHVIPHHTRSAFSSG